ncbi:MAG TPA: DsbA family protein [Solirubrobacteraceae bacterium]|jgi:2-hydroxychromene-2-carboxylate isomerase|nr:DsbA family protein [Solirubrobacteraceae bacterium]
MPPPRFFFGAMSPYSWFAAERIDRLLPDALWHGVLAGAIFKANDRVSWGITGRRDEGMRDCEARAAQYGLGPIRWPEPWPTSDLLVARAMAHAGLQGGLKGFALQAMRLCFLEGADLGEPAAVLEAAARAGIAEGELGRALGEQATRDALRRTTDEALALGVIGVPTVVVGEELFWGDDRLEEAAEAHARLGGHSSPRGEPDHAGGERSISS